MWISFPQSPAGPETWLGKWDPHIMRYYDLAIIITIWRLIQTCTCEMGSSIFSAMSRLKFVSTIRDSLPSMLSIERTNGNVFPCLWQCLRCLYFLILSHQYRSVTIDSNFQVSASSSPSWCWSFCTICLGGVRHPRLQTVTPMMCLPLWSAVPLLYEGFFV